MTANNDTVQADMSEDKDLLARISRLAGKNLRNYQDDELSFQGHINIHKAHTPSYVHRQLDTARIPSVPTAHRPTVLAGTGGRRSSRTALYTRIDQRGRISQPHRHRTLVFNKSENQRSKDGANNEQEAILSAQPVTPDRTPSGELAAPSTGWISKRDRHMQLINPKVYDKDILARNKGTEETRRQKALKTQQVEKGKISRHLESLNHGQASNIPYAASTVHTVYISGLRFTVMNGGSKLLRNNGVTPNATNFPHEPYDT